MLLIIAKKIKRLKIPTTIVETTNIKKSIISIAEEQANIWIRTTLIESDDLSLIDLLGAIVTFDCVDTPYYVEFDFVVKSQPMSNN